MVKAFVDRIEEYYLNKEETDKQVFKKLALFIYYLESGTSNDLYMLAKLLPDKYLKILINYYDGDVLKLPSKDEFNRDLIISAIFYLREFYRKPDGSQLSWKEVNDILDLPESEKELASNIAVSRKINKIKSRINREFTNGMNKLRNKEIDFSQILRED